MDKRATLQLFGVLFFVIAIGEVVGLLGYQSDNSVVSIGSGIVKLAGITFIIQDGTILKARPYIHLIYFFIGLDIVGAMFKIMHWFLHDEILMLAQLGIAIVYTVRFLKKTSKKQIDVLKCLWVIVLCISATFKFNHYPWANQLLVVQSTLFLLMLFSFLYNMMRTKDELNSPNKS
jgi:hypothetical protein